MSQRQLPHSLLHMCPRSYCSQRALCADECAERQETRKGPRGLGDRRVWNISDVMCELVKKYGGWKCLSWERSKEVMGEGHS